MRFYFYSKSGTNKELTEQEARKLLSERQIKEGLEAKQDDPDEEVSYMAPGGTIVIDF